jgi:hypothetical protein
LRDAQGNPVRTSAFTQAEEARKQQASQFNVSQFGAAGEPTQGATTLAAQEAAAQRSQIAFQNAARLSEQSGVQYTVNAQGQPEVLRDAQGNPVRTSTFTQAEEARKQQERISTLDIQLRQQLGMTEATGQVYSVGPDGRLVAGADTVDAQMRRAQLTGQFGGQLTQDALQNAYARAAQLSQATGLQYTVNPQTGQLTQGTAGTLDAQLRQGQLTGRFQNADTLEKLQQNLEQSRFMTQQTGNIYDAQGALTGTTIAGQEATFQRAQTMADSMASQTGNQYRVVRNETTGMFNVQEVAGKRTESAESQRLDRTLRQALGMSDATGFVYDPMTGGILRPTGGTSTQETVQGQISRSQTLMALAQALGGLSPTQIAQLLGTTPPPGGDPQPSSPRAGDVRRNPNGWDEIFDGTGWRRLGGDKLPTE